MTIALTDFDGLCGFRPLAEISHFLQNVPSLRSLVGDDETKAFLQAVKGQEDAEDGAQLQKNRKALQSAFSALMKAATSKPNELKSATDALVDSAKSSGATFAGDGGPSPTSGQELADLVVRLNSQFPGDVGLFVVFFVNYVKLSVGEAMFLKADDIHAYLSGDIVECMASSDNVVRAGFTPKFKDVDVLTDMLTYNYAPIEEQKMQPTDYTFVRLDRAAYSSNSTSMLYDPPIEEFAVVRTELKANASKATFEPLDGPSIIICVSGSGTIAVGPKKENLKTGFVYFVGATAECQIESDSDEPFVTFKAFCELNDERPHANGKI